MQDKSTLKQEYTLGAAVQRHMVPAATPQPAKRTRHTGGERGLIPASAWVGSTMVVMAGRSVAPMNGTAARRTEERRGWGGAGDTADHRGTQNAGGGGGSPAQVHRRRRRWKPGEERMPRSGRMGGEWVSQWAGQVRWGGGNPHAEKKEKRSQMKTRFFLENDET